MKRYMRCLSLVVTVSIIGYSLPAWGDPIGDRLRQNFERGLERGMENAESKIKNAPINVALQIWKNLSDSENPLELTSQEKNAARQLTLQWRQGQIVDGDNNPIQPACLPNDRYMKSIQEAIFSYGSLDAFILEGTVFIKIENETTPLTLLAAFVHVANERSQDFNLKKNSCDLRAWAAGQSILNADVN